MVVSHNLSAINTYNQMNKTLDSSKKSMEKLSSGYKINRAADDAAGLAISEKMRSQIRGLNQASENASQGISMIQTAEGALNGTHSILQRMRELAVQSANDTNAQSDREALQNEVSQLISEINRIGNTTEFNGMKILNGDFGMKVKGTDFSKRIEGLEYINSIAFTQKVDGVFMLSNRDELALWSAFSPNKNENIINIYKDANNKLCFDLKAMNGNMNKEYLVNTLIKYDDFTTSLRYLSYDEETNSLVRSKTQKLNSTDEYVNNLTYNYIKIPFDENENEYYFNKWGLNISLDKNMINNALQNKENLTIDLYEVGIIKDFTETYGNDIQRYMTKEDIKKMLDLGTDNYYCSLRYYDNKIVKLEQDTTNNGYPILIVDNNKIQPDVTETTGIDTSGIAFSSISTGEPIEVIKGDDINVKYKLLDYLDDDILYYFNGEIIMENFKEGTHIYDSAMGGEIYPLKYKMYHLDCSDVNYDFGLIKDEIENNEGVVFHIGANSNQSLTCTFNDMRAKNLGLTGYGEGYSTKVDVTDGISRECKEFGVNISTRLSAEKAIEIVDNAIQKVSEERSRYGAIQNRLEYTINNLNTTSENMSNAESTIRDTDMADEVMNETKSNILQRASQAMLLQAMQRPQQVLQLLK